MSLRTLLCAGLATSASAAKLLVSSYGPAEGTNLNGRIDTLDYTSGALKISSENSEAGLQPTWIDLAVEGKAYILDEAWATPNISTLHTFDLCAEGSLTHKAALEIPRGGPVATQFYNGNKNVAIAHYGGHGLVTYTLGANGSTLLQNIGYEGRTPGPKPQQADGSHVHHSVIDPTGKYIVFPDLGLDVTHVFCIDETTGALTPQAGLQAPSGYGPRHAAFWKSGDSTYLAIIHEISSKILTYKVDYVRSGGLTFAPVDEISSFGAETDQTVWGAGGEIQISPDSKFLVASNRNVTLQQVPNVDPSNSTQVDSDSVASFKIEDTGKLSFVQLAPSGGRFPRHFEISKDGSEIAVANQLSSNVRIYKRDVATGMIGDQTAAVEVIGAPNNVRWL